MALTDRRVVQLAKQKKQAQQERDDAEARKKELDGKLCAELTRRGTKTLEAGGVKVTHVQQFRTVYDYEAFAAELTPRVLHSLKPDTIDATKLAQAIAAGKVDPLFAAQHSREVPTADYTVVSIRDASR